MHMQTRPPRSAVPVAETWRLEDLYPTQEEWEVDFRRVEAKIPSIVAFKGTLSNGPEALIQCLEQREAVQQRFIRVGTYGSLRASEDGTSPGNQALSARVA